MQTIEALQNATPTDFSQLDKDALDRSSWDVNRNRGDELLHVRFYSKSEPDPVASEREGRAIHREVEYVTIMVPGDKTNIIDRPIRVIEDEPARFPRQYAAFKAGAKQQATGTPLGLMPGLTPSLIDDYKALGILTVEQLAEVNDGAAMKVIGMMENKQRAQALLKRLAGEKDEAAERRVAELEAKLAELSARLESADAEATKPVQGTPLKKAG